jgi:hypothetical protein
MLDGGSCACGSGGRCRCLLESLGAFHRHLHHHFDLEERGWSKPRFIDRTSLARIDALTREHVSMRLRLGAAIVVLEESDRRSGSLPSGLEREIRSILDDLLRHELSEAGLFQSQILSEPEDVPSPPVQSGSPSTNSRSV